MAGLSSKNGSGKSKSNGKTQTAQAAPAPAQPQKPAAQIASAAEKYINKKTAEKTETRVEAKPESKPVKAKGPTAQVQFTAGWRQNVQGELTAGGVVTINYDPARAQANHSQNGNPAWGVQAFVKLVPSGQVIEQPVVDFEGSKTAKARPATIELTPGTTEIQVWFKNWTGGDNQREQWDSNYGNNYRFAVRA